MIASCFFYLHLQLLQTELFVSSFFVIVCFLIATKCLVLHNFSSVLPLGALLSGFWIQMKKKEH